MNRDRSSRLLRLLAWAWCAAACIGCAHVLGQPRTGSEGQPSAEEAQALHEIRASLRATVVWSSSRFGNHDLLAMDVTDLAPRRLTQGEHVDWYPRISPSGADVLFTRSRRGWVSERDANRPEKWDICTVPLAGGSVTCIVRDASWGTWISEREILFSRGTRVIRHDMQEGTEQVVLDTTTVAALGGADAQQPALSKDGRYLTLTLRGSRRETGVFDLHTQVWTATGVGCQVTWIPGTARIMWVNPSGNGGSEVLSRPFPGDPPGTSAEGDGLGFIDLPGRRSHEYFPRASADGRWLVWAATQRGHDHDIADYELYVWRIGAPAATATRLTFHSSNDRWPDIHITGAGDTTHAN